MFVYCYCLLLVFLFCVCCCFSFDSLVCVSVRRGVSCGCAPACVCAVVVCRLCIVISSISVWRVGLLWVQRPPFVLHIFAHCQRGCSRTAVSYTVSTEHWRTILNRHDVSVHRPASPCLRAVIGDASVRPRGQGPPVVYGVCGVCSRCVQCGLAGYRVTVPCRAALLPSPPCHETLKSIPYHHNRREARTWTSIGGAQHSLTHSTRSPCSAAACLHNGQGRSTGRLGAQMRDRGWRGAAPNKRPNLTRCTPVAG